MTNEWNRKSHPSGRSLYRCWVKADLEGAERECSKKSRISFETDLLCIWSINWIYSRKESSRFLVKSLSGLRQNMEWISRFSCHIFRHTFASRFCENETNIKVIQEVMGHADVSTTMNIYAEANPDVTKSVIEKLSKNMDIF